MPKSYHGTGSNLAVEKLIFLLAAVVMLFSLQLHANESRYYVVVKGDALSSIALSQFGKPIYSKKGSLGKLIESNPDLKNENLIFPGQKILIGHLDNTETIPAEVTQSSKDRDLASDLQEEKKQTTTGDETTKPIDQNSSNLPAPALPVTTFNQSGEFGVSTGFEFTRVDAKDRTLGGTSSFITDMSPKFSLSWDRKWTDRWAYYAELSILNEKVTDDTSTPAFSIEGASKSRSQFSFGGKRTWSENSRTDFGVGFREQLFSHTPAVTSITMDRIPTGFFRLNHEQTLFRIQKAMVFGSLGADYLLGSKASLHTTKPGYAADFSLGARDEFSNFTVETKFNYGISKQSSNLIEASETHLGFTLGLSWSFNP